jgi:hypothetical protein
MNECSMPGMLEGHFAALNHQIPATVSNVFPPLAA